MPLTSLGQVNACDIPTLTSERLQLRAHRLDDLPAACRMWSSEAVTRFIGGRPRPEQDVWTAVQRSFGCWALLGYGFWAIEEQASQEFIGEIGLLEGLRDIKPNYSGTPEVGWCLLESAWGKGIASEALSLVTAWVDSTLNTRTVCIIDADNAASVRVAQKNGFRKCATGNLGTETIDIYERWGTTPQP